MKTNLVAHRDETTLIARDADWTFCVDCSEMIRRNAPPSSPGSANRPCT